MERSIEKKYILFSDSDIIPIAGAGQIMGIGPYCQTGDTYTTRDGNKTTLIGIACRVNIELTAVEALGCSVRIVLGLDRKPDGADPGITDCFTGDSLLAAYSVAGKNRGRFQFLFDKTIDFDTETLRWSGMWYGNKRYNITYDGNAGTVADIEKGHLFAAGFALGNAAAINTNWYVKMSFIDM